MSEPSDVSTAWVDPSGSVDPAPTPTYGASLLANGDFSEGRDFWSVERISGVGLMPKFDDDTLCVTAVGGTRVIVGWPEEPDDSIALSPGRYEFSFRARGKGVHLWAKVGRAYEPYDVVFEREWTAEESGWHDVVYEFDFAGDDAVGVAFNIDLTPMANTLCFDEVTLRRASTDASNPQ